MRVKLPLRRTAFAAIVAGSTAVLSTGCATSNFSIASLNPFSKASAPVASTPATTTGTGRLAAMRQTATGQMNSVGMATKSAFTKTKNGITGMFGGASTSTTDSAGNTITADDPTRLDTAATVGPDVFVAQGQLWETTGDFQKAMQSYTRALEAEPKNAAALASVARLHFRQENYQPAADFFARAIAQSPNEAGLHNDYGLTQAKLGDHAGAAESIGKALALAPTTSRFANNLAEVKYTGGDSQGALAVLMQHNSPAVAHFNMAFLHYKAGKLPEAKTHLTEVVKYEPQAASDTGISKAVARSKEMLAQIEGPATRIAQAAPQAYAAANQFVNAFQQPVQQTAQVGSAAQSPAIQASAFVPSATPWNGGTTPNTQTAPVNHPVGVSQPAPIAQPAPTTLPANVSQPRPSGQPALIGQPTATSPTAPAPAPAPTAGTQTPYTLPPGFFNQ